MIKVLDNFLEIKDFNSLTDSMTGNEFPWFLNKGVSYANDGHIQFYHNFFLYNNFPHYSSNCITLLEPILNKINPLSIVRIKANLLQRTNIIHEHDMHVDYNFDGTTCIYYLNTNNGYTLFEDGSKIESVANRLVLFDANIKHAGTSCTDALYRAVINFNFLLRKD